MPSFLQLALLLALFLFMAKMAGYLSTRLNQPAVLGELLIGILLGPTALNVLHLPFIEPGMESTIAKLSEMGVMLLMFLAGLELHFRELTHNLRVAVLAGTLGVLFPALSGWGLGLAFGMDQKAAIFLGLILSATSVSISAQTLMELRQLRSRVGLGLLGAAVLDDVLVILLLSVFLAFAGGGGSWASIVQIALRMVLFLGLSIAFGLWVLPRWSDIVSNLPISQGTLAFGLVIMLTYGLAAEVIGHLAAITGAFLAGLMFARTPQKEELTQGVHALAYGLFVPVFFIHIGLSVNGRGLVAEMLWFALAVVGLAIVSKWLGAGLGSYLGGLPAREAVQLGAGMISRGEVGLIVANVGMNGGLVTAEEFVMVVLMVLLTTLVTPPLLRWLFAAPRPAVTPLPSPADPTHHKEEQ